MLLFTNKQLLEMTKDITVAVLSSSNTIPCDTTGKATAEFMQAVHDKLVELNQLGKNDPV